MTMERGQDGFSLQASLLVRMLGITTPHLRQQAEKLLKDALSENSNSPITDGSFLGRIKKLLFKPTPRKDKLRSLNCFSKPKSSTTSGTPTIAREVELSISRSSPPVTPNPARGDLWKTFCGGIDEDEVFDDPFIAAPEFAQDPVVYMPPGQYNSRGQRLDEDGDICRDERVYMCEEAIYSFPGGVPHITDTYDLYALVKDCPLDETLAMARMILERGIFTPQQDLQMKIEIPMQSDPITICGSTSSGDLSKGTVADGFDTGTKENNSSSPPTNATISQKRNLIAHYIKTIALPPLNGVETLTNRQRKKLLRDRGKRERARLRQLKTFVAALRG